jgi:hypothetical protein
LPDCDGSKLDQLFPQRLQELLFSFERREAVAT